MSNEADPPILDPNVSGAVLIQEAQLTLERMLSDFDRLPTDGRSKNRFTQNLYRYHRAVMDKLDLSKPAEERAKQSRVISGAFLHYGDVVSTMKFPEMLLLHRKRTKQDRIPTHYPEFFDSMVGAKDTFYLSQHRLQFDDIQQAHAAIDSIAKVTAREPVLWLIAQYLGTFLPGFGVRDMRGLEKLEQEISRAIGGKDLSSAYKRSMIIGYCLELQAHAYLDPATVRLLHLRFIDDENQRISAGIVLPATVYL